MKHSHATNKKSKSPPFEWPGECPEFLPFCAENQAENERIEAEREAHIERLRDLLAMGVTERDLGTPPLRRNEGIPARLLIRLKNL